MKLSKAKTRLGILNWLAKLNPQLVPSYFTSRIFNDSNIVAVHVNKNTGEVHKLETANGKTLFPWEIAP